MAKKKQIEEAATTAAEIETPDVTTESQETAETPAETAAPAAEESVEFQGQEAPAEEAAPTPTAEEIAAAEAADDGKEKVETEAAPTAEEAPKTEETAKPEKEEADLGNVPTGGFKESATKPQIPSAPQDAHSKQYYDLDARLKAYIKACGGASKSMTAAKINERMLLADDIVQFTMRYPFKENVELVFKTVCENFNTAFSAGYIMAGTNKLTLVRQQQFGQFWTAFTQLAAKKLEGARVLYRNEALRVTLRNDQLLLALDQIRKRLEA